MTSHVGVIKGTVKLEKTLEKKVRCWSFRRICDITTEKLVGSFYGKHSLIFYQGYCSA